MPGHRRWRDLDHKPWLALACATWAGMATVVVSLGVGFLYAWLYLPLTWTE